MEAEKNGSYLYYILPVLIISLLIIYLFFVRLRKSFYAETEKMESEVETAEEIDISELPDDLGEVISIIKKEGERITQKELRKRLGYSDAKMSLIIADLERRGLVEKIKKGRGNIIFLKQ